MRNLNITTCLIVINLLMIGCTSDNFLSIPGLNQESSLGYKDIIVSEHGVSQSYTSLGPVETLLRDNSFFSFSGRLRSQVIEQLKREAEARYGQKVDAIINTTIEEHKEDDGYGNNTNVVVARGEAVSFKSAYRRSASKRKVKHKLKTSNATVTPRKSQPAIKEVEPDISPEELLK